jgi:hypothetical protein
MEENAQMTKQHPILRWGLKMKGDVKRRWKRGLGEGR